MTFGEEALLYLGLVFGLTILGLTIVHIVHKQNNPNAYRR